MSERKALVLDANILIRAVMGRKARQLIKKYHDKVRFYAPDVCFLDAHRHLPTLLHTDEIDSGLDLLNEIARVVEGVDRALYEKYEYAARERIAGRDPDDWPVVAAAMLLDCAIWTEDQDFFGGGIATWTSDRVEMYLRESS